MDDHAELAVLAFLEDEGLIGHDFGSVLFGDPGVAHGDADIAVDLDAFVAVAEVVAARLDPWGQSEALSSGKFGSPPAGRFVRQGSGCQRPSDRSRSARHTGNHLAVLRPPEQGFHRRRGALGHRG